jgi:hypothetical protein
MKVSSIVATAVFACIPLTAHAVTFSFLTDTWSNSAGSRTGYLNGATSGTLFKEGITLSFSTSFAGTATSGTRNLEQVTNENPFGFNVATKTDANDLTTPFFPRLRSGHRLFQRPSPGKQFPSNQFDL